MQRYKINNQMCAGTHNWWVERKKPTKLQNTKMQETKLQRYKINYLMRSHARYNIQKLLCGSAIVCTDNWCLIFSILSYFFICSFGHLRIWVS